jgi:hypothetical protein
MKLKSFGCSFIFGSELADDGYGQSRPTPSKLTWPAHVAQHLGYEYSCHARPGSGNLQITEQILNQIAQPEPALYVIGWTWIERFDYYDANWDSRKSLSPWKTIMPIDKSELAKVYYRDLHSEYRDKFSTLLNVKLVIDTLTQNQLPFIMTYMDDLMFDQRWNTSPAVGLLQEYIQPHMTQFDGLSFLDWSRKNGHPETENWHPLESAHLYASQVIVDQKF